MIDTGVTVNILDEDAHKKVGRPKLTKHGVRRKQPHGGGPPLKVMGRCELPIQNSKEIQCHPFHVVSGNHGTLLGYSTAKDLGLTHIVNSIKNASEKYQKLHQVIGKLTGTTVKLHINETVQPVAQRRRTTPFYLREKVEKEIKKLLDEDIIEKIEKVEGVPHPGYIP